MPGRQRDVVDVGASPVRRRRAAAEQSSIAVRASRPAAAARLAAAGDDGGFHADRCRPAVDHQIDAAREIGEHMRGRRGRDMAGAIGRRRDDRPFESRKNGLRHRMIRHADGDGVKAGGGKLGDRAIVALWQHQRQRPRPECGRELRGRSVEIGELAGGRDIAHMGDQRIE